MCVVCVRVCVCVCARAAIGGWGWWIGVLACQSSFMAGGETRSVTLHDLKERDTLS